jgi:hypothetical protein
MTLDKMQYDEQQARLMEADQRMENFHRFRDPGPTRYVLKNRHPYLAGVGTWWFKELGMSRWGEGHKSSDEDQWSLDPAEAKRFDSATEAALYAAEHDIDDVEVVAV